MIGLIKVSVRNDLPLKLMIMLVNQFTQTKWKKSKYAGLEPNTAGILSLRLTNFIIQVKLAKIQVFD